MKNFNVSRRLAGLLAAFGISMILAVAAFSLLLHHAGKKAAAVTAQSTSQLTSGYELLEALSVIQNDIQRFIRLKDPDVMETALTELKAHQQQADSKLKEGGSANVIRPKLEALIASQNAVVDDVLRGSVSDAYEKFFGNTASCYDQLLRVLSQEQQNVNRSAAQMIVAQRQSTNRSLAVQAASLSAVFIGLIVFGWRLKSRIVTELTQISGVLSESSTQLTSAAGQVSSSSQTLAEGASTQAASIEETSASLEEMSSMIRANSDSAQKANTLARQAREAAEKGSTDMTDMSAAIADIKASSDDIATIIKTIDEIAFQTNILALNAAVEAARAGEAGMGFAVVADEVRNLARRSADAAKETTQRIETAIHKTGVGVEISQKVASALNEIVTRARQVDELAAQVANASREQSVGINQLNAAIGQMDHVTQSNAASAEESAAAAEELNAQAQVMKMSVNDLLSLIGGNTTLPLATERPQPEPPKASANKSFETANRRQTSLRMPEHF